VQVANRLSVDCIGKTLYFAVVASNKASEGDPVGAYQLGRASYSISSVGIVVGFCGWSILIWSLVWW
jgi:hypothetical protein